MLCGEWDKLPQCVVSAAHASRVLETTSRRRYLRKDSFDETPKPRSETDALPSLE
jgi:hypothetical protein